MENLLTYKAAFVGVFFAALFILERKFPYAEKPVETLAASGGEYRRFGRNLGLWVINTAIYPIVVLPITLYAAHHSLGWRPELLPAVDIVIDLLLLDLWIYWWHRANHQLPFLWRFHQVHHLDQWLDVTSAVRFHFGEVVLAACARGAVIWLLGIGWISVLLFETLVLICSIFHHSNVRLNPTFERALSKVIITPSIHWVHHHAVRVDTDSNYGTVLSVWDSIFQTASENCRQGISEVGIEGKRERKLSKLVITPWPTIL